MKKIIIALSLLLMTVVAQPVMASDVDMTQYSCKELIDSKNDIPFIMFWIDGYMSALSENAVMSSEWMQELTEHYMSYCKKNPKHTIMDAMEAME